MKTFCYIVLFVLFAIAAAQQLPAHIATGSFLRLLPVSSTHGACWDNKNKAWKQDDFAVLPAGVGGFTIVSDTEAYFFFANSQTANGVSGQLFYSTQTGYTSLFTNTGVFLYQPTTSSAVQFGQFSTVIVNKARTRLWVIGQFTKFGTTAITQLTNSNTIVCFDISTSKTAPTVVTLPASATTLASVDATKVWTQDNNLVISATDQTGNVKLYRVTPGAGWTPLTDNSQSIAGSTFKQHAASEVLFAYGTSGLLSSAVGVANPTYQKLTTTGTTWDAVATSVPAAGEINNRVISPGLWAPISSTDVIFVFASATISSTPVTNTNRDNLAKTLQYFQRASGNTITVYDQIPRLSDSLTTFPSLVNVLINLVYDDVSKALLIDGTFSYYIKGAYQSPFADPTTGVIPEDRSKYIAKRFSDTSILLRLDDITAPVFDNFFGGSTSGSTLMYTPLGAATTTYTCFYTYNTVFTSYNLNAPLIAAYNSTRWINYPLLNFDYDTINGAAPVINVVERVGTSGDFFVGGSFRSIDGTVYNSILKYSNGAVSALAGGVSDYNRNGDGTNSAGTSPSDSTVTRYYDTKPGTVTALKYDATNGNLYVAGTFFKAGKTYVRNFAVYNEAAKTWSSVGKVGAVSGVSKMVLLGDYLIVGGSFTRVENRVANRIAMYNLKNQTWEPMGQGLSTFNDMEVFNGYLFVSGTPGGRRPSVLAGTSSTASSLAAWNPSTRTFSSLYLSSLPSSSGACSVGPVCDPTITNGGPFNFQVANGQLFLTSANQIFRYNGYNFDFIYQAASATKLFVKNGVSDGARTILYNTAAGTFAYSEPHNYYGSYYFNFDRSDNLPIADAPFTTVVSSSYKVQFNMVLFAFAALVAMLFM